MPYSNGIITAPISINDVRTALGVSTYDLGTLCKNESGKIRILSISKPTDKTGWNPSDPQTGEMDDLWYRGVKCYGILKPYNSFTSAQWTGGSIGGATIKVNGLALNTLLTDKWKLKEPVYYRLTDFEYYKHTEDSYPLLGGHSPVVSSCQLNVIGNAAITANYVIRYQLDDVISNNNNKCGSLGLSKLFNLDYNKDVYFGIAIYGPPRNSLTVTQRDSPLCLVNIPNLKLGNTDPSTGSNTMAYISSGTIGNIIGGSSSVVDNNKFYPNEEVFVIPFLATYQNNIYYVIGLNNGYADNYAKFKIGSEVVVGSRGIISSGKAVISVLRNEDGTYTFYLAGGMDLDLTCSSYGSYISFVGNVNISQADGNSYTQKLTDGKWSGASDSEISGGYKVNIPSSRHIYNSGNISGWSSTAIPANRPPSVILKPYNNASSFKVSISLNYWYKTNRVMTGIFTVNTASVQNSYTVNLA